MIASLNDQITVRILDLDAAAHDVSGLALCWLGMGSEGRLEQTIATDQDNGLIFAANDETADAGRDSRAAPAVRARGQRSAGPLRLSAVQGRRDGDEPEMVRGRSPNGRRRSRRGSTAAIRKSLLAASIFFDFRALWGEPRLAAALRADVAARARANPRFLKQMSDNALAQPAAAQLARRARPTDGSGDDEAIDLKLAGSVPFVDAARIFALAAGITATNTVERFVQAAARRAAIPTGRSAGMVRRIRVSSSSCACASSIAASPAARPPRTTAIPTSTPLRTLSELERRILKEAMRQIRRLQQRLELDYPG